VDALKGRLFAAVIRLMSLLPLGITRGLVDAFASLAWLVRTRAARTTATNIALCFPELDSKAQARLGVQSLQQTARLLAEAGMFFHWPRQRWSALLRVTGEEHIERARAEGRGALILAPHYGNWECMALYLGAYSATALYDPPRIASLENPLREARERSGMTLLPIDRRGLRAIYEAVADGGVTALLPDQVPARSAGVYAPFFGHPALTMTFAHRLIQRTNPVVLLGVARRVKGGFSVEFAAVPGEVYADDPETSAAAMNRAIEALVRTDPSQYQWEYKRFRRQPHGTVDVYSGDRKR